MYLTYEEFKKLTNRDEVEEPVFDRFLPKAQSVLDNLTRNFYHFNDIIQDNRFRSTQFKKALCAQILYFVEMGGDTYEAINKMPQSFSAGRTSVSLGSRYNAGGKNESKELLAEDVMLYLEGTGLLYRGVMR
ncbi:hypothetical protein M2454_001902 [Aequitasia blattaphilus]|uniref:Phage protein n=1 Tax=Aequitasia blattaphilus TaxID=2949332 RepID=A0ABT1E9S7_9FIRM|nr:hypothetical protein [Aequitasia blattaphilus]MCP1102590.1 hypothetical protein [Aequitasia blattaphilus]MCR8615230.1 hypothetical protein [Aequitasia blattaphilus]